jgi:TonB-linked SusC/RagA family outer membrane protein
MTSLVRRLAIAACAVAGLSPAVARAQQPATISGRVLTEAGAPIQSASVAIGALNLGTYTDAEGAFRVSVPAERATGVVTLAARRVGYQPKSMQLTLKPGANIQQDFVLVAAPTQLTGIVVTGMSVQREKSQLGTAQQQVSSETLNRTQDPNVLNQLEGKVSGVTITAGGTQGGATRIVSRGASSLAGNNQPLVIVDGVPVFNDNRGGSPGGGGPQSGSIDFGNTLADINPNDIATMTVLKGPNAAAIYGSQAANGAIVITTKKGQATDGRISTQFSSTYSWEKPSVLPDYQNLYGQGAAGKFSYVDGQNGGTNDGADQSWGPRLDGQPIDQFTGPQQPWIAHPDNVESFFNTGKTLTNSLAFSGGTDRANARLSVGNTQQDGYIPNSSWNKLSGSLSGQLKIGDKLTTNATIQYLTNNGRNRPGVGYNTGILEQFIWFGRQVDMNALRNYMDADGKQLNWNYNFHNNPFWLVYENPEYDRRKQLIVSASADYQFTDWLRGMVRAGTNNYNFRASQAYSGGNINFGNPAYAGSFTNYQNEKAQNTSTFMLTADKDVTSRLNVTAMAGAGRRYETYNSNQVDVDGISVPHIYNVSNAAVTPSNSQYLSRRQVNSVYGTASFTWDGWWTVEGTARNDWSSTLPKGKNSYFYPSVNTSVVLTDAIPSLTSNVLSYAKVRGSLARVGNDADVYQLFTTDSGFSTKVGALPQFTLANCIANPSLKPEVTTAGEAGLELGFLDNRVTVDATYYTKTTKNQIINLTLSPASGFTSKAINAGEIRNHGFEGRIAATPFRTNDFEWTTGFNYAANRSEVVDLYGDLESVVLGGTWYAELQARKGGPFGVIWGYSYARDDQGNKLVKDGLPVLGDRKVLGTVEPDWVGGWSNDFRYKQFSLGVLFDFHQGGSLYSVSNMFGEYAGVFKSSLRGREVSVSEPGIIVKGIDVDTGEPNNKIVTSEYYFQNGLFPLHEEYTYDASYVKLRELRVGYDLPESIASKLRAQSINISFVGRNLWLSTDVPNIDPEFAYSNGNFQGMEFAALPNARSLGINLRVTP